MNLIKLAACITTTSLLVACGGGGSSSSDSNNVAIPDINMANAQKVINTNADIALAAYTDSVATAKTCGMITVSTLPTHTQPTPSWARELEENQGNLRRKQFVKWESILTD